MCVFDLVRLCVFAGRGVVVRGAHHAGRGDAVAARRRGAPRPDAACFVKNLGVCDERDCVIGEKQSGARACVSDAECEIGCEIEGVDEPFVRSRYASQPRASQPAPAARQLDPRLLAKSAANWGECLPLLSRPKAPKSWSKLNDQLRAAGFDTIAYASERTVEIALRDRVRLFQATGEDSNPYRSDDFTMGPKQRGLFETFLVGMLCKGGWRWHEEDGGWRTVEGDPITTTNAFMALVLRERYGEWLKERVAGGFRSDHSWAAEQKRRKRQRSK